MVNYKGLHHIKGVKNSNDCHRGTEVLAAKNANNTKVKSILSLNERIFMASLKPNICVFCG
jgi:hypothetical protein